MIDHHSADDGFDPSYPDFLEISDRAADIDLADAAQCSDHNEPALLGREGRTQFARRDGSLEHAIELNAKLRGKISDAALGGAS